MLSIIRPLAALGGAIATLTAVVLTSAGATSPPTLVDSTALSVHQQLAVNARPATWNGNIPCFENKSAICEVDTHYGSVDSGSNLRLAGEDNSLPVISYVDGRAHFIPISNSTGGIVYTTNPPYGLYLHFYYNATSNLQKQSTASGTKYFLSSPPDAKLTDGAGHQLAADTASMNFSANGQYMVVSMPNVAMLRVNLTTFEVTPFAPGFNYAIGLDPAVKTAISNDGRYALVASETFGRTEIYDLSTCAPAPSDITAPVSCPGRSLQGYLQGQIPGFGYISHMSFISGEAVSFYAKSSAGNNVKYILASQPGVINFHDFLALGDSYISGEGAYEYLAGTDTDSSQCHVSRLSYPLLAGRDLGYNSYHSVTCSGATTNDIINSSTDYSGQTIPGKSRDQYENSTVNDLLSQFQQGYIYQNNFVEQYQPKAVVLSVGGNDIGFTNRLLGCLGPGTCYDSYEKRLEFVKEVNSKFDTFVNTYKKIKNAGPPDMRVYVVGYPEIAKPGGDCALNVRLNNEEVEFAQLAVGYLNTVIQQATSKAGVFYVDNHDSFYGHRMCEAGVSSVAMNGATAGGDFPDSLGGPIGRESYHPNSFGHMLMENNLLQRTDNLTTPMPAPNSNAKPPNTLGLPILVAPLFHTEVKSTRFTDSLAPDVVFKNQPFTMLLNDSTNGIMPSASAEGSIWSTPTPLGTFTTGQNGDLAINVSIPSSVEPGFHTIHIYANSLSGAPMDIFKTVYVAATPNDFDGDGTADALPFCFLPSGTDVDKDSTDDACDSAVIVAPTNLTSRAGDSTDVVALGASITNTGAVSVQFVPRIKIGESQPATRPPASEQGSDKVLATSTNKAVAGQGDSASNSLPRYGLLFLSGISGLGLLLSKKYS